jgi:hypothetical protein
MTHCVTQQQPIDLNTSGIDKVNRASLEMQTSPNPCNKGTQVKLNLNTSSIVELTIFNALAK